MRWKVKYAVRLRTKLQHQTFLAQIRAPMIWKQEFTLEGLNGLSQQTMLEALGISFTGFGDDYLQATLPVDERTVQPQGLLHGGATAALAETLGSVASLLCIEDTTKWQPVGIELNINHLRSATAGQVIGTVRPIRLGRRIHVWEIDIRNETNKRISVSRLTVAIVEARR